MYLSLCMHGGPAEEAACVGVGQPRGRFGRSEFGGFFAGGVDAPPRGPEALFVRAKTWDASKG